MKEITPQDLIDKLNNNEINYYNIYNSELDVTQYCAIQHYIKNPQDNINVNQKVQELFYDIEVYRYNRDDLDMVTMKDPINALTLYSTFEKVYHIYVLLLDEVKPSQFQFHELENIQNQYKKDLLETKYINEEDEIKIHLYNGIKSELKMLTDVWDKIKNLDPAILSGFHSDKFDLPYIVGRLENLTGSPEKAHKIISRFGKVEKREVGFKDVVIDIPEYTTLDLRHLYMPRGEGGLNYGGKTLEKYSLDFISDHELGLVKLSYKEDGLSLDKFYETDPVNFIKYNLIDVALCVRLNSKLQHIGLHNLLRRDMYTPLGITLKGSSMLFDTYYSYALASENKYVRHGVVSELGCNIPETEINNIRLPSEKKMSWTIKSVNITDYRRLVNRFPGAYVKRVTQGIFTPEDGIHIDLDASLPPWEDIYIKRNNIIMKIPIGKYEYQENDETLTWDDNYNVCYRKVIGKLTHNWNGNILRFVTETNKTVDVTDNHSIFYINLDRQTDSKFTVDLADAKKLKIGDFVLVAQRIFEKFNNEGSSYKYIFNIERIKEILVSEYQGKVYDISVEETERFFAGGGLGCHNTAMYP